MEEPSPELARRVSRGDQGAFHEMYERYADRVFRHMVRIAPDRGSAERATEQVLSTCFDEIDVAPEDASLDRWVFWHVRRVAFERFARAQATAPL